MRRYVSLLAILPVLVLTFSSSIGHVEATGGFSKALERLAEAKYLLVIVESEYIDYSDSITSAETAVNGMDAACTHEIANANAFIDLAKTILKPLASSSIEAAKENIEVAEYYHNPGWTTIIERNANFALENMGRAQTAMSQGAYNVSQAMAFVEAATDGCDGEDDGVSSSTSSFSSSYSSVLSY